MSTAAAISMEQYLQGPVPDPDVEYIDGELREKPAVMSMHGRLQTIIGAWFERHAEKWGVVAGVEIRIRVAQTRVRLPDVIVDACGPWPETLMTAPLIVMEILSASESLSELSKKLRDYKAMGIRNVWVIDPETRLAWVSSGGGLLATARFTVQDSPIYLDVAETFARYDRFR